MNWTASVGSTDVLMTQTIATCFYTEGRESCLSSPSLSWVSLIGLGGNVQYTSKSWDLFGSLRLMEIFRSCALRPVNISVALATGVINVQKPLHSAKRAIKMNPLVKAERSAHKVSQAKQWHVLFKFKRHAGLRSWREISDVFTRKPKKVGKNIS